MKNYLDHLNVIIYIKMGVLVITCIFRKKFANDVIMLTNALEKVGALVKKFCCPKCLKVLERSVAASKEQRGLIKVLNGCIEEFILNTSLLFNWLYSLY